METQQITGAQALVKSLIGEGVDTIFGYQGGAIMPVYDVLFDHSSQIRHILTRHEQGAIHAAQGYARVTRKTGVCFATSGPGATNLITGLADAQLDSTPLVCITGQVASPLLGTDAFQEQDIISISMPVTKWNFQITSAEEIALALAKAFYIASSGRPGPVLIDISKDAQLNKVDFNYKKCEQIRGFRPYPKLNYDMVEFAAALINMAKKPLILAGQGVNLAKAEDLLLAFAEKTGIPVACTLLGLSSFPSAHPLFAGMLGMHGNYAANMKTNNCDLLIAIGMRFDDRVTGNLKFYAKQAKIIHIEIDNSEINKNVKVDIGLQADAAEALEALMPLVKPKNFPQWVKGFDECYQVEFEKVIKNQFFPNQEGLSMAEVINALSLKSDGKLIVVTDVGQHQMIAARYFKFKLRNSFVTSGGLGTMGFGLPAAIGAKIGKPENDVVLVVGDGGFQMTIQELGTIFQEQIAVKIILLNNSFLGMVRQWQEMFFQKRYSHTELKNPNFAKIAEGYDIKSRVVDKREQLESAMDEMLSCKDSFLLQVNVEKETKVLPMVPAGASISDMILE